MTMTLHALEKMTRRNQGATMRKYPAASLKGLAQIEDVLVSLMRARPVAFSER